MESSKDLEKIGLVHKSQSTLKQGRKRRAETSREAREVVEDIV